MLTLRSVIAETALVVLQPGLEEVRGMAVDEQEAPRYVGRRQAQAFERPLIAAVLAFSAGPKWRQQSRPKRGHKAPQPVRVTAHARLALGDHHAYRVVAFALLAKLVVRVQRCDTEQQPTHRSQHLAPVDRAAPARSRP